MKSVRLKLERLDLLNALNTLGVTRRKRFSSIVPVWLRFDLESGLLQIVEDKGTVTAYVPAKGEWPATGATIDLSMLKRALKHCAEDVVHLHAVKDAILLASGNWHVTMNLLNFGPDNVVPGHPDYPHPLADLPLFRWVQRKS